MCPKLDGIGWVSSSPALVLLEAPAPRLLLLNHRSRQRDRRSTRARLVPEGSLRSLVRRAERHVRPTSAAHIISLSKTSTRVSCSYRSRFRGQASYAPVDRPKGSRLVDPLRRTVPVYFDGVVFFRTSTGSAEPLTPRHHAAEEHWARRTTRPKVGSTIFPVKVRMAFPSPGRLDSFRGLRKGRHLFHKLSLVALDRGDLRSGFRLRYTAIHFRQ